MQKLVIEADFQPCPHEACRASIHNTRTLNTRQLQEIQPLFFFIYVCASLIMWQNVFCSNYHRVSLLLSRTEDSAVWTQFSFHSILVQRTKSSCCLWHPEITVLCNESWQVLTKNKAQPLSVDTVDYSTQCVVSCITQPSHCREVLSARVAEECLSSLQTECHWR